MTSPYLASGIISARRCVRSTMKLTGSSKVDGGRNTGIGRWVQELAWRDFYVSVLVGFPRVSMGRPFIEKYADIVWEGYQEPAGKRASELEEPLVLGGSRLVVHIQTTPEAVQDFLSIVRSLKEEKAQAGFVPSADILASAPTDVYVRRLPKVSRPT